MTDQVLNEARTGEQPPEPPDLDILMQRMAEDGGCEAACPHRCRAEPDGTCPRSHPSWLIVLGLI